MDFGCHPLRDPAPLFDATSRTYRTGVTPSYLMIPTHSAACPEDATITLSPQQAKETINFVDYRSTCNANQKCRCFTYNHETKKGVLCSEPAWAMSTPETDSVVGVKPDNFFANGFAVYLNYMGVCTNTTIVESTPHVTEFSDAVHMCLKNPKCDTFTLSTSEKLVRSIPGFEHNLWMCNGKHQAFIPREGYIYAVRVQSV